MYADMKPPVLHVDLTGAQCRVLHLRRKRMRHRIAENAEANRRIDVARDVTPVLQIGERVAAGSLFFFVHVAE